MTPRLSALLLLALGACAPAFAQDASKVDNTQINQRDRHAENTTPMDQPNDTEDVRLAAAVRKAIVADSSLSTMAQNVKLVANRGIVTLRGPVENDVEKARVQAITQGVMGVTKVENQLDIKH